ncbi:MAG: hydrogenase nickel incorporation protein HypB [Ignavibacteria bacterium]|nr:hydrogenase nickel incorporation protein HypB [Ignavibacteria bacterium]
MSIITVERKVLKKNDDLAAENRACFMSRRTFAVNLLSSPGSGKTSLLERTVDALKHELRIAIIEGDVQTDNDARRIAAHGVPVAQIVTNGLCHLEASLVQSALPQLPEDMELCVIENVGNLVCPASYDLGEHMKITIVSTTEGDDKPLKYPAMFRRSSVLIVNKIDLLPYVQFSVDACIANAHSVNPELLVFTTSCSSGEGIDAWCDWLRDRVRELRDEPAPGAAHPA